MPLTYVDPWEGRVPSSTLQSQPKENQPKQNSGIFGDLVDAVQQGGYQSFAGDAEAIGQVLNSDTFKNIGQTLAKNANQQTDSMTDESRQALSQNIFKDDADNMTGVAFDDGATNWRTWALQFGALGGQVIGTMAGGLGAGSVVKAGAKTAIKAFAKEAVTKEAQQLVAKSAVKEAIRNGALNDVRQALLTAPDKAAVNAVLDNATQRLGGIATTATAGAMAAGMRAQQARDDFMSLSPDQLNNHPEFQQEYWNIADAPENKGLDTGTIYKAAQEQLAEKAATTAFFDKTALLSDFAAGAYVPGVGGVLGRGAATASKVGRFGLGLAEEGATEAWQGGETQRAVNEAIKEWGDESRDSMAGVIKTRWEEGTIGGLFGGMGKVFEGQHHAPTKPIISIEGSANTGNPVLDNALAQTDSNEQSRYNDLTDHVDTITKPAYMRNGEISPGLESAIAQFRMDELTRQQEQLRTDGIMRPLDNPVVGNPDEPAFLRSQSFNPTGRDLSAAAEVDPSTAVQQALAGSRAFDPVELLNQAKAAGNVGPTPMDEFSGELLPKNEHSQSLVPASENDSVTVDGQSSEVIPESMGIGYNNTINMPGEQGNGVNDNYVPPVTADRITPDASLDVESTRDPRSPVAQAIDNAGSQTDAIFGQLQSLRVTRRGKPFASQKEAQLASRKTETPIELPTGGFGVVDKAELEQAKSNINQLDEFQQYVNDHGFQPVDDVNDMNAADMQSSNEQATSPSVDMNESTTNSVVAQNHPNINVNDQVAVKQAEQPIADQAAVTPSPDTVTPPVVAMEGQPTPAPANAEQISEADLKDLDLLKEHAGKWKYRYAVGANWQTASTKESALERARGAHQKAIANGDPLPTKAERYSTSEAAQAAQMEQRYGKISIPELEKEHARLGSVVADLQQTGKNEFNGNGGRRTGAATANEGARLAGQERLQLESYIEARKAAKPETATKPVSESKTEASETNTEKTIDDHLHDLAKYQNGEMNFDEFKKSSSDILDNEKDIKEKLSSLTKPEILKRMGRMFEYHHKQSKKAEIVNAAYEQIATQLRFAARGGESIISESVSFSDIAGKKVRKTSAEKAREELADLTPEQYAKYQEKAQAATAESKARIEKLKKQITDPQTLDDFETFLNYKGIDKLTPEQKARYEDLKAERSLDKRDQEAAAAKEVKVIASVDGDIVKTKHTKEGHDLYVVKLGDRVDAETYKTINAKAKELGGYYSKFKGAGAVPGFQFRSEEQAKAFHQYLSESNNATTKVSDVEASTDITVNAEQVEDNSSKVKQANKLRERAASVREKAQAELNAERKSNTAKRAREAAYAVARAEGDLRFANMLDVIADGIDTGEIKYLRNMTAGAQLETLDKVLRRIVYSSKMTNTVRDDLIGKGFLRRGDDSELTWTDSAPVEVITQYAEMPGMDYFASRLREIAKEMQGTSGFKQAGVKIMNYALAAINAENKIVTLSDADLIDKLKQYTKQHDSRSYMNDVMADYDRLVRMGIASPVELRAALRELHKVKQSLKGKQPKRDPVKQKEDALKMRLLNNRNSFIDFFPTPESHANDVIARAGIEPGMRVLEPSAGHGALAVAARDAGAKVDAVELSGELRDILTEKGFNLIGSDFMETEPAGEYDAVVMNPPFSNDMDIDHVKHAYSHLKPGGRLVAIVSSMAGDRSNNKNKQFKEWLNSIGATEEMMPEGSFKDSMNPTSVRTKIIELQKPEDAKNTKPHQTGSRVIIHTPKGKPVEVQYQLVSAGDLVVSNEFDGRINADYPQELQPRDRTKASYQQQVKMIAANPEGSRLSVSPESDRGAPIVHDLVVESGNGRSIGIKQAYKQGTAKEYQEYLIEHASEFGFTPEEVKAIHEPVLVRQRVSELSPEEQLDFVVDSNTDAKMANSATEDAKADARYLDNGLMDLLNIPEGGDLLAASNERFLSLFSEKVGVNGLNVYKASSGRWNDAYRTRVSNAIFAYGYDNDSLLKAATGDTSETGKNLTNALINNAAKVAELRSMDPETAKAFVNYLAEGIDVMTSAKRNGQSIQEVVNQGDMLSGGVSHYGGAIAEMLSDASRSGNRLTETISQITGMLNESARSAGQLDLLTGEQSVPITAEEAINAAERDFKTRQQQEQRTRPSQDLFGANPVRIGDDNQGRSGVSRSPGESETKRSGEVGGLTLSDLTIPTIDKALNDDYNRSAHVWGKSDFNESLKATAQRLIDDLSDPKKHLLDTEEQRNYAASAIGSYLSAEAKQIKADIASAKSNPSWIVTGRSGRNMKKYNDSVSKEMDRLSAHVKSQEEDLAHIKKRLEQMKPDDVKTKEAFSSVSRQLGLTISAIADYMRDGRATLEKDARKWASPKAGKLIEQSLEIDREGTISSLKKADESLQDVGGLLKVIGSRSSSGKMVADLLSGTTTESVKFSKVKTNEAEQSGKGMAKPEATLAAKEWLRQFKTDINVEVVKDQAEFESALADRGFANSIRSGEMDNAAYLPDTKTILINASAIQNPKRLKQIMRHEILVHHGLRYVVGEDAYVKIMNAIAKGYETSPAIRDAVDTVTKNYADKDMFTQMEEAFGHYAETRPADSGPIGRLWQRIVSMVKSALQKVGFIRQNEAETVLDDALAAIAENMRKGIEDGVIAERSGDAMFSRSSAADDELMTKLGLGPKQDVIDKTKERINTLKQADRAQVKSWIDETIKKANTQILDALAPIKYAEDAGGKVEASDSGYVAARLASGSATVMNATMLHGLPEWKDGVIQRKDGTGEADSLLGIFESLGPDLHNWLGWMAGHRGEILLAEGRENLLTPEDISALKAKGNGKEAKFDAARQKWNALNKAVLDLAEEAGLFTTEDRAAWDSEWYVPFFRETEDGDVTGPYKHKGIANQTAGIKKLKGGTANVNDILQNIFTTTSKTIDAAMKNMAAQKVVHNLAETDLIEVITKPNLMDIKAAVKNQNDMMIVKLEGEDYLIRVNDKNLFNAMTMIDQKVERGAVRRLAMKAKHILTAGVTASPDFMLRNFLRDAASTWAINEDGFKPMIDSIRGMKKAWKMDDSSIDMMFSGASFMGGNLRGNDPEAMASAVRKALRRKGMSPEQVDRYEKTIIRNGKQAMDTIGKYWEKYERVGEAVENGSREAVYEAAIKAGKTHAQAAFEAKDLMDFSMMGASKLMQVFVDVLPFFNARMQGLGKLGRAIKANPKQIAKRGGVIAGASLALLALNWDDERYEDLPDWDKDLNWHFWLGDQHFRIPKPFEIGLMFGTLPERMVRTMGGKDTAGKFGKVVARNMLETFAINPIPQVVKPLTEAYFNYDPFRGGPIESMSDMNVNPEARYDERTSLMMRELGELTGMSPKKLEYVISGYTGTMGGYVMAMGDGLVRMMGDYGDSPALRADQIPILKSVYQGSAPAKSTQAMQDFYQMVDEANQVYATIKQYNKEGRIDDANSLLEENRDKLAGRKTLNKAQLQFRALRNEMSLIQRDRLLDSDQKRDRLDKLLKRRNDFAAQLIQRFE